MARAQTSFGKKENEKKRAQKRTQKEEKKKERQAGAEKGQSLEEMFAYVDENGNIVDSPPDPKKRKEVSLESIQIGVPKQEDRPQEDPVRKGSVTFFNDSKGYGFIRDQASQESIFVHVNALGSLRLNEGDKVTFETEAGQKGPVAVRVRLAVDAPAAASEASTDEAQAE